LPSLDPILCFYHFSFADNSKIMLPLKRLWRPRSRHLVIIKGNVTLIGLRYCLLLLYIVSNLYLNFLAFQGKILTTVIVVWKLTALTNTATLTGGESGDSPIGIISRMRRAPMRLSMYFRCDTPVVSHGIVPRYRQINLFLFIIYW
jgi:hypothetical protein